ncbi:hypothetical protein Tco_0426266 [Tanacetum coccineum]
MLKFPVQGGIVMLHNNTIIPTECRMVAEAPTESPPSEPAVAEGIKKRRGQAPDRNKAIQEEVAKLVEA